MAAVGRTKVSVGNASTLILAANAGRRYAAIVNDSDEDVYLALGQAAAMNEGIRINSGGGFWEVSRAAVRHRIHVGAVYGICSSGGKNVTVQEVDER